MPRLTVAETVYHEGLAGPRSFGKPWAKKLATDEQPYQRYTCGSSAWERLETGWLTGCSMVLVENTGKVLLEVGLSCRSVDIQVLPGESCRFRPARLDTVFTRGITTYTATVVPE